MIYLIFSRAGQIAYFTMLLSYMLYLIFQGGKKFLKTAILFIITLLGIIIMSHNERMQNSYRDIKNLFSGEITNNNDRLAIWVVSLDIIRNNLSGVGNDTKMFFENYRQK
jgi:O-antigen ligase